MTPYAAHRRALMALPPGDRASDFAQWSFEYDHEDLTIDYITNFAGHHPDDSRLGNRLAGAGHRLMECAVYDWFVMLAWNLALASVACSAEDRGYSLGYDDGVREEQGG